MKFAKFDEVLVLQIHKMYQSFIIELNNSTSKG